MGYLLFHTLLLLSSASSGTWPLPLTVRFLYGHTELRPGRDYPLADRTVRIDECRFYLSGIRLKHAGTVVWSEPDSYHLVELKDSASRRLSLSLPDGMPAFDTIECTFGIDSLTQAGGVRGGALDPVRGMYWTWQSGYIHLKMEGSSPVCPTRGHAFQLHIGGYQPPHQTVRRLQAAVSAARALALDFDVAPLLAAAALDSIPRVMSPGERAAALSRLAAENMRIHVVE